MTNHNKLKLRLLKNLYSIPNTITMNDKEEILNCFDVGENVVIKFLFIENHIT